MIQITGKEIYSDAGKFVHRVGTDTYFKRATRLPSDSIEMFEEVDAIPAPPTEEEIQYKKGVESKVREMFFSAQIPNCINTMNLTDKESLAVKEMYPEWKSFVGKALKAGNKVQHDGKLYKVRQDIATVLDNQPPSTATAALYEEVNETHSGTADDPIPYNGNMALENGKYYSQNGAVYRCTRNTEIPVYHPLAELVGIYVERVES